MKKISHGTWAKMWLWAALLPYINLAMIYLDSEPVSFLEVALFGLLASVGCLGSAITHYQVKLKNQEE